MFGAGTRDGSTYSSGTSVGAGLPNITGNIVGLLMDDTNASAHSVSGCFGNLSASRARSFKGDWDGTAMFSFNIDASRSSGVYGASNTMQPPAYVVNYWHRDS